MVTIGELVVGVALFWLFLIILANRVNLQKYNLFVSSGFLLYMPDFIRNLLQKIAGKNKFWEKLGSFAVYPTLILVFSVPIILSLNLVRGFFLGVAPVFIVSVIDVLRVENFALILPILAIIISLQMFIKAIYALQEDVEIERTGILLLGVIFAFFARIKQVTNRKNKIKTLSVIVLIQFLIVLVALPIGQGLDLAYAGAYEDSQGALITSVAPNSPAFSSNLANGEVITEIRLPQTQFDNQRIPITSAVSLSRALAQIIAGVEMVIQLESLDRDSPVFYRITGITPPEDVKQEQGSYLGITTIDYKPPKSFLPLTLPYWSNLFFEWLFNISLLFVIQGVMPIPGTSGEELFNELKEVLDLEISERQHKVISYLSLVVLAMNVLYLIV